MTITTNRNGQNGSSGGDVETEEFSSLFEDAFTQYALAVVTSRALPDARDGLKPVQRRILWCMLENGYRSTRSTVKSASVVGDVLKSYHPHSDMAVYDAAVRMAQPFTMRYPLIEGQGNFGSIDGDSAAAYRYTEMRLSALGELLLQDIDQETVPFEQTYLQDPRVVQPVYLPARIPPVCNPVSGIAVGLSTEIAPHNLRETLRAAVALLDNPDLTLDELLAILPGPDFPTGGQVVGTDGIRDYFETGKGRLVIRGEVRLEEAVRQRNLVVTEIPPLNRARLVRSMINAVNDGEVTGVTEIRNESDEEKGMRIVIELERNATPEVVLNQLYRFSDLETSLTINMVFLFGDPGQPARQPRTAGMLDLLKYWNRHQLDVITKRAEYQLRKAQERLHVVEGLIIGAANADDIVRIFQAARDRNVAKEQIKQKYDLSDIQADVIANMTLAQVTKLDASRYAQEKKDLAKRIKDLTALLASEAKKVALLKEEVQTIIEQHADARRTRIGDQATTEVAAVASLVEERSMLVMTGSNGRVKAVADNAFRRMRGQAKSAAGDDEEPTPSRTRGSNAGVRAIASASTLDFLLVLTRAGRVYLGRGHDVPLVARTAAGETPQRLFALKPDEEIAAILPIGELSNDHYVVWFTRQGRIKKTSLSEYQSVNSAGLNDLRLLGDDQVATACISNGSGEYLMLASDGQALRFGSDEVRPTGRDGQGVAGMSLKSDASVVAGLWIPAGSSADLLVASERGLGKRTALAEFPLKHRATAGIAAIGLAKDDHLAAGLLAMPKDEIVIASEEGRAAQLTVDSLRRQKRATRGSRLLALPAGDRLTTLARVS
ncbi:MAG TPA: DNA gyrase subunit A [Thermomicrobiaceae bacterium]|nr:DNA gyrase subunit A [Thermomicrobiaceae bacterium]